MIHFFLLIIIKLVCVVLLFVGFYCFLLFFNCFLFRVAMSVALQGTYGHQIGSKMCRTPQLKNEIIRPSCQGKCPRLGFSKFLVLKTLFIIIYLKGSWIGIVVIVPKMLESINILLGLLGIALNY